ncbi:DUF3108 domain-containing protein [Methylotenera versatilis]|uniref:DUF3108 domain-containing protein n=1 Tax=Methylotenera versatilis TaxID=1055487 RepID=UPI0006457231|nr:DUF3108 domain-containing protein [Methylotenera versatilis]
MFKQSQWIIFFCLVFYGAIAHAAPKSVQLEYDLKRDGKLFAKVVENFSQDGNQYKIESVTKGVGVYALLGERKLLSSGSVTKEGLKPKHFESHQGDNNRKSLINDFDWAKNTLNMQVKGEVKTQTLQKGTQDLLSYAYQFMFAQPTKARVGQNSINLTLTSGKKLKQYQYKIIARGLKLNAAGTDFKTLHIANTPAAGDDKKELWLAEDKYYLPVQYNLTDEDGASFEQTLTKIHVE